MFILDDAEEAELDLPRDYGVDDVPVIVQDKRFADDGSLIEDERGHELDRADLVGIASA